MRLFVAVDPDEALRERIAKEVARIRARLDRDHAARVTWVGFEGWHITLVFLGEVDNDVGSRVIERLAAPFDLPAFRLVFDQPGLFPPRGRPRVLWVGFAEGARELTTLHDAVVERLSGVPLRREDRAFTPHLTLARLRPGSAAVSRDELDGLRLGRLGGCTIDRVTLYRSHLGARGARYEALVQASLK